MIGADTLHFSVPREALKSFNPEHFSMKTTIGAGGELQTSHLRLIDKARPLGLSKLLIHDERVELELSAKILGEGYIRGISAATVEQVPERIGRTKAVSFDADLFLSGAELYRIDITTNIRPTDLRGAIYAASVGSMNTKWNHTSYGRSRDNGFVFTGRLKSNKRRLSGYDKFREMTSRGKVKHADELRADNFRGVLRVETNLRTHRDIRQMLGIDTLRLTDALSSQRNPNLQMFDEIVGSMANDRRLIVANQMMYNVKVVGMKRYKDALAMETTFERLGGEWSFIETFVRNGYDKPSGSKRELAKWKRHYATWLLAKKSEADERDARVVLEEVRDLLRAA